MRFIDANVFLYFLYAILKPRRKLSQKEFEMKEKSKAIVSRVNAGEEVFTAVAHLSEVANVLEDAGGTSLAAAFVKDLLEQRIT